MHRRALAFCTCHGGIAQLVEHTTENRGVPSSSLGLATPKSPASAGLFLWWQHRPRGAEIGLKRCRRPKTASDTVRETVRGVHHRRSPEHVGCVQARRDGRSVVSSKYGRVTTWEHPMRDVSNDLPIGTHCEWCGAEFEPDTSPPKPRTHATAPAPAPGGEPVTHCEWCGAEYPVPGGDA